MKIKVCYLIGSLGYGGAEGQVLELMRRLDPERFQPSLVLETNIGIERSRQFSAEVRTLGVVPVKGRKLAPRGYWTARALRRLVIHLNEIRPDILHAFLPGSVVYASAARMLKGFPRVIASRRSLVDCYRPNSRIAAFADVFATRASDFAVANSRAIMEELIGLDGVPESRTELIHNGVDAQRFSPSQRPGIRAKLGWTREEIVFGMVANFLPYKGHSDFVKAAAIIHERVPRARFLLVGEDRGELPATRNAIVAAGLDGYTKILSGTDKPEEAFGAMDVYICTSRTEGFSNVLLEAMATGLPLIATNVGGNSEAIEEGVNGTLVPPQSPELIANAAVFLAGQPERRAQWARSSRDRVEQAFSLEKMVQKHEEFYRRTLAQDSSPLWKRLAGRA